MVSIIIYYYFYFQDDIDFGELDNGDANDIDFGDVTLEEGDIDWGVSVDSPQNNEVSWMIDTIHFFP